MFFEEAISVCAIPSPPTPKPAAASARALAATTGSGAGVPTPGTRRRWACPTAFSAPPVPALLVLVIAIRCFIFRSRFLICSILRGLGVLFPGALEMDRTLIPDRPELVDVPLASVDAWESMVVPLIWLDMDSCEVCRARGKPDPLPCAPPGGPKLLIPGFW